PAGDLCLIHWPLVALSLPTLCILSPGCNLLSPLDLLSDYPRWSRGFRAHQRVVQVRLVASGLILALPGLVQAVGIALLICSLHHLNGRRCASDVGRVARRMPALA